MNHIKNTETTINPPASPQTEQTDVFALMQRPEWLRCLPRLSFNDDGTVEITLLRETMPSYYDVLWERTFPVEALDGGIYQAFDAALKYAQEEKP